MYNFLSRFPIISYNGNQVNNILVKIAFDKVLKQNAVVFYPYVLSEGERPDIIASEYYGDSRYSWLVYLSNNFIDPYYDWPLPANDFKQFIINKYGSVDEAQTRIAFWRNNWYTDDSIVSPSYYESLPSYAKKYWTPVDNDNSNLTGYSRKKSDLVVETNKIISLLVSNTDSISINSKAEQFTDQELVASGDVDNIVDNKVILKNVLGTFSNTEVLTVSDVEVDITSEITLLYTPIPVNESVYWSYVTYYDYEDELNENKKHIQLVDRRYVDLIEKEIDNLL